MATNSRELGQGSLHALLLALEAFKIRLDGPVLLGGELPLKLLLKTGDLPLDDR